MRAPLTPDGKLGCMSCPEKFRFPATRIANAYGARQDGSSLDWPLCEGHVPHAMVVGWFPIRKVGDDPPYDPEPSNPEPPEVRS